MFQVYLPVQHSNGELLVQVTNSDGQFCGWADGRGKYDIQGSWEVCDKWAPTQAAQLGRSVAVLKSHCIVRVERNGIARRLHVSF